MFKSGGRAKCEKVRQSYHDMKVIKDWSTVIKMGKLLKMETFSRLFPGPGEESGWRLDKDSRCT